MMAHLWGPVEMLESLLDAVVVAQSGSRNTMVLKSCILACWWKDMGKGL
jgi:hypothetical protein